MKEIWKKPVAIFAGMQFVLPKLPNLKQVYAVRSVSEKRVEIVWTANSGGAKIEATTWYSFKHACRLFERGDWKQI